MPKYSVLVPFTGSMLVEVEADSPADAKEAAFEAEFDIDSVHEFEFHDHVVEGNVFYGVLNSMEVELIDDGDDQPETFTGVGPLGFPPTLASTLVVHPANHHA